MSVYSPQHIGMVACAWLCVQSAGCGWGDIVLGTGGSASAATATGPDLSVIDAGAVGVFPQQSEPQTSAANSVAQPPSAAATASSTAPVVTHTPPRADEDAGAAPQVARPSSGCSKDPARPKLLVNGRAASFLLDIPRAYDQRHAYPLVMAFRGTGTDTTEFRAQLGLASIADAVIVYPDPLDTDTPWQFQRDMALVDELVSQLGAAYCLDRDRVFAIGNESGALFANLVGCVRAEQVRGIATLSNAPPPPGPCFGNTAVWLLQRTDLDPNSVGSGLGNRDYWATRNACNLGVPVPVAPAPCVEYSDCTPGLPVHFCEYAGAAWPSYAVAGAWSFFERL